MLMYLDRRDVAFRKDEKEILDNPEITLFRPGNRVYPAHRGYSAGEVVKARVIEVPGDDKADQKPVFSNIAKLVKISTVEILSPSELGVESFHHTPNVANTKEKLLLRLEEIYGDKDYDLLTKITMNTLDNSDLDDNRVDIIRLFESGILQLATLPEDNIGSVEKLLNANNFSLTFINHDYAGITPKLWNFIAREYDLDIKNSMAITKPENLDAILDILQKNDRYIGGGFGVGFKDTGWDLLRKKPYGFIDPVANEMESINFVAHFGNEIHGYNSDALGYVESLSEKLHGIGKGLENKTIILLGAGGTARGIALELVNRGVGKIIILNRTPSKAAYIAEKLNQVKGGVAISGGEDAIDSVDESIDVIINLTVKGADGEYEKYSGLTPTGAGIEENLTKTSELLTGFKGVNPDIIVSDINLTKTGTTPLLDRAKNMGIGTLDGKMMVVYQGTEAIWTVFGDKIIKKGGTKEEVKRKLIEYIFGKQ